MSPYVLGLAEIDKTMTSLAGGKGANLGELSRIESIRVPEGFCVTTEAFKRAVAQAPSLTALLDQLSLLKADDRDSIAALSAEIRGLIEGIGVPQEVADEVTCHLARLGERDAYAVRSSATAEDLPAASFAGQQDTYLNVTGPQAILTHIGKCWASLFTERAVTYRLRNGFDHRKVYQAVVVQKMVSPQAAGVLVTADPVTSNRKVSSIDAGFGLGEALVSGLVNADTYKVRDGKVIDKHIAAKKVALYAASEGGTKRQEIEPRRQNTPGLTDEQILRLEQLGRKIEAHFGHPQDIEWCLVDDTFYFLQSRPITTLYPIPEANDQEYHVYLSVAHQQMMTDPMKPLGLSLFQLTALRPMYQAGGRLFVDVTQQLASPASRKALLDAMGQHDPRLKDALTTIVEQGGFGEPQPNDASEPRPSHGTNGVSPSGFQAQVEDDPAIVARLIERSERALAELKKNIRAKSGTALFDFILEDIQQLRQILSNPESTAVIMTAMGAASWINEKMGEWLGERNAADTLSQSVPNNVTSEMGLALLDVADAIRPYPEVVEYLQQAKDDNLLDELVKLAGGRESRDAICAFLDKYGARCVGEIDITKPRWSERPSALIPLLLSNIRNFAPNAGKRRFEQGRREALRRERELLARLKRLPDGKRRAEQAKRAISLMRTLAGYREYPKYAMVKRYFVYKQALLKEAERLVQAGVIRAREDVYYLTFEELREVVRTNELDYQLIARRKDEYRWYERLAPPRVITSDGEIVSGEYRRENLPSGAIAGLPVSAGVVEGRARVILKMEDAELEEGDILVTTFTDPSWTPLFVSVKGLVTEVGGLMTHGAVIAREYGLPAVVGVDNATKVIKDGQRIRVDGTEGYVEVL